MKIVRLSMIAVALCLWHGSAHAIDYPDTMTETQPLSFGTFAMRDNAAAYSMIISPSGVASYSHVNKLLPFNTTTPTAGVFSLTDFAPSTLLIVSIADTVINSCCGGPNFDLIDFTFTPNPATTSAGGALILNIGATLRTSGSGVIYNDGTYSGSYDLSIDY